MIITNLLILITALFLIIYGNLNLWLGLPILILSVSGLTFQLFEIISINIRLNSIKKKSKVKWVGEFILIEGFNLVTNQNIYLILTRRDDLYFQAEQDEFKISLSDVDGIFITKGQYLLNLADNEIKNFVNREFNNPVFNNIRNLIRNNHNYAKKFVMLISLKLNDEIYHNVRMNQDLIIMVLMHGTNNFRRFIKRPEIRSKVRFYNRRMNYTRSRKELGLKKQG
ncbi:MAG: hypothetical protein GX328_01810 [Clostridiaceae bacterium]|nr:hypothetical protein [Clostridiaceae bacterium]